MVVHSGYVGRGAHATLLSMDSFVRHLKCREPSPNEKPQLNGQIPVRSQLPGDLPKIAPPWALTFRLDQLSGAQIHHLTVERASVTLVVGWMGSQLAVSALI